MENLSSPFDKVEKKSVVISFSEPESILAIYMTPYLGHFAIIGNGAKLLVLGFKR